MKNAQYIDDTSGQVITGLICREIEVQPFATVSHGQIKSGVMLKLRGYNREGLLTGLLDDHGAKKIIKEICELLTESEEKNKCLAGIKTLINQDVNP